MSETTPQAERDFDADLDAQIAANAVRAGEVLEELLNDLEGEPDPLGVVYHLWCDLTRHLAEGGWSPDELARDAVANAVAQCFVPRDMPFPAECEGSA